MLINLQFTAFVQKFAIWSGQWSSMDGVNHALFNVVPKVYQPLLSQNICSHLFAVHIAISGCPSQ